MLRFTACVLAFSIGLQSLAHAHGANPASPSVIKAQVHESVERFVQDSPSLCKRALRRAFAWQIRKKAIRQLTSAIKDVPTADPELLRLQVQSAVQKSIESLDFLPRQIVGGGLLLGIMSANAELTVWLLTKFPSSQGFFAMLISQFSILSVNYFGAPFLEPLSARIRGFGFWLFPSLQKHMSNGVVNPIFQQVWKNLQLFSLTEQTGAMRIQSHMSYLENRMSRAFQGSLLISDPEKRRHFVIEQLAVASLWAKVLSPDIPVDSVFSLIAVRSNFSDFYDEKEGLADAVYARVLELHKKVFNNEPADTAAQAYYRKLVDTWYR